MWLLIQRGEDEKSLKVSLLPACLVLAIEHHNYLVGYAYCPAVRSYRLLPNQAILLLPTVHVATLADSLAAKRTRVVLSRFCRRQHSFRKQRGPRWPTRVSQLTEVGALLYDVGPTLLSALSAH